MTRRSKRQRDVGLVKDYVVRPQSKTRSTDGEQQISLRTYVYNEELPTPIVLTRPLKPRSTNSDSSDTEEEVFPGPLCISCSGVDSDQLVWCSGCGDPYHVDCASGYPKSKIDVPYRWLCVDCRQQCVSCHDQIISGSQIFKCKWCWRIIHKRCVDPAVRGEYKQNGWPCFHCQRLFPSESPAEPCSICARLPIKHCPSTLSCNRCQSTISSCCLDLSSSVLQYKDFMKLPYLCETCDPNENWKSSLVCSWRRKLLMLLDRVETAPQVERLKSRLDTIDHLSEFAVALSELPSPVQVRPLMSEFFPFFDSPVLPSLVEMPPELCFHRRQAPLVPRVVTSLFYSPPCCFCNAKPAHARLIYLGQDEWCHAACALWVGIKVTSRGNYSGLLRGLSQGLGPSVTRENDSCKHCGYTIKSTIAAKCQAPGCGKVMHFYCAALVGWLVVSPSNTYCGRHKPRQSKPREKKPPKTELTIKTEPGLETVPPKGKPGAMITPVVKTEPNKESVKTGKPASFEKMMSKNPMADKPLMFPSNKAPPPKAPLTAPPPPSSSTTPKQKPQMDPQTISNAILANRKDFSADDQQKMNRLIDSLFAEESPKNKTVVLASSSAGGVINKPPSLKPKPNSNPSLHQQHQHHHYQHHHQQQPLHQPPRLQQMPTSTQTHQQRPLPDVMPTSTNSTNTTKSTTNKTKVEHSAPLLNSLLNKQLDGAIDDTTDDDETEKPAKKPKKKTLEEVFDEMERTFIQRGRARPDHNDQAHHWKSKWAKGVSPSDLYVAIGGCEITQIGRIHPDASQKNPAALFPTGYTAAKWFWSVKRPGTIAKYILSISVTHRPPPPEQYTNTTINTGSEEDLAYFARLNRPKTPPAPRVPVTPKEYSYEEFENTSVELEEIAPPPKSALFPRKRSCESDESLPGSSKRGRYRGRRGRNGLNDDPEEKLDSALLTDDEDTESMSVRRSVRVWSNKIKKELVEEVLPDEIDGWKIPTDDEELENGEDALDSSFTLAKPELVEPEPETHRVKSQKVGKYNAAKKSTTGVGRGRRRKRKVVSDSESEDEWGRNNGIDTVIEELAPDYDQIDAAAEADNDTVLPPLMRPNNIEIISMDEIKERFVSSEEEDDKTKGWKRIKEQPESPLAEASISNENRNSFEVKESNEVEDNPLKSPLLESSAGEDEPEVKEDVPEDKKEDKVQEKEETVETTDTEVKVESASETVDPVKEEKGPENDEEEVVTKGPDVDAIKKQLCNRGSPMIVLERLKVAEEEKSEEEKSEEEETPTSVSSAEKDILEKSYEETVVQSLVQAQSTLAELDKSIEFSDDEEEQVSDEVEQDEEEDEEEEEEEAEVKSEEDEEYQTEDEEDFDIKPTEKRALAPLRSSPRTKSPEKKEVVRRSTRERKMYRCPIKECEKKPAAKMEDVLRHINVNHPSHYATLITRKHSAVHKVCSLCKFCYLNGESFDAHVEYTCKRNKSFLAQYGKDDKSSEIELEVLKSDFGWVFEAPVVTATTSRRRHSSRAESAPSPASPGRPTRRKTKPETPVKKTRSGRTVKIPQVDGNDDSDSESSASSIIDATVRLPQFDGQHGNPTNSYGNGTQDTPGGSFFVGDQSNTTGPFSGVIPILMPPGPGQSIEQAIAQPVIRMQPVMQQTNVIHVGQGGTVILPSSQQPVQNMQTMQQSSPQVTPQAPFQSNQQQQVQQQRYLQPTVMVPAPGTYTFVQSQPYQMQGMNGASSTQQQQPQVPLVKREAPTDHYFPLNLNQPSMANQQPSRPQTASTPAINPLRTPALTPVPQSVPSMTPTPPVKLSGMDQRLLEQQRLQEHRAKQRAMEEQAMQQLEQQQFIERQKQLEVHMRQQRQQIQQNQQQLQQQYMMQQQKQHTQHQHQQHPLQPQQQQPQQRQPQHQQHHHHSQQQQQQHHNQHPYQQQHVQQQQVQKQQQHVSAQQHHHQRSTQQHQTQHQVHQQPLQQQHNQQHHSQQQQHASQQQHVHQQQQHVHQVRQHQSPQQTPQMVKQQYKSPQAQVQPTYSSPQQKPAQQKTAPTSVADTHARQQQIMEQNRRNDQAEAKRRSLERKRILDEQRKIQMEENRRRAEQERLAKQNELYKQQQQQLLQQQQQSMVKQQQRPTQFNQVKPKAPTHGQQGMQQSMIRSPPVLHQPQQPTQGQIQHTNQYQQHARQEHLHRCQQQMQHRQSESLNGMQILQQQERQQQQTQQQQQQQMQTNTQINQKYYNGHYQGQYQQPKSPAQMMSPPPVMSPPSVMSPPMKPLNPNQTAQPHVPQKQQSMQQQQQQQRVHYHQIQPQQQHQQQKIVNVQRSPKIDENKIAEIKRELKSPPTNSRILSPPGQNHVQHHHHHVPHHHQPQQQQPKQYQQHRVQQQRPPQQQQGVRPSIIRRTDSPSISLTNQSKDKKKKPKTKPQKNTPSPAFGTSQLRVAPGAGPLPGLKQEPVPRLGTLREEQERRLAQMSEQQKQQHFINQQSGIIANRGQPRYQQQSRQMQFVQQRTTPVVPSTLSQPRPAQPHGQFNSEHHRLTMPLHSSPGRKPWDLNLTAPKRQNGIEVVSRKPRQDGIEVVSPQFQQQNNMRHHHHHQQHQQQQRQQQQQHGIQAGTVLSPDAPLRPGFQIYNGQLIEVRPTQSFLGMNQRNGGYMQQSHLHHRQPQQQQQRNDQFRKHDQRPAVKRPGWDSTSFSVEPSISLLDKEAEKMIIEKKNQATEKMIKKSKMKATKLIWDPIVLDESVLLDTFDSDTGMTKATEIGFDDAFGFSPLLSQAKKLKTACDMAKLVEKRPSTPPSVESDQDEYELFFTIVSDDGFRHSGKDPEKIWKMVVDGLEDGDGFPGAAPKSTRPDVFKAFGFTHDIVRFLLEQLPNADCVPGNYNSKFFPRTHSAQLVARNPKGSMRAQGYCGSRNPSDMFSFLNSEHRDGLKPDLTVRPMNESDLPLTMRFRRMVETSRTSLQVLPSTIHGRGLFARRAYELGELVIEYAGEVIRRELCDKREKYYDSRGIGTYMFRVDDKFVVDATMDGGRARFINHSCGPNCMSKIITVDGRKHICIIAGRNIDFGEELTYDYKFDRELGEERILCGCQAPNCRGYMN